MKVFEIGAQDGLHGLQRADRVDLAAGRGEAILRVRKVMIRVAGAD